MTVHNRAIDLLREEFPTLETRGFKRRLVEVVPPTSPDMDEDELEDTIGRIVPDGFLISVERREIVVLEVEDTSSLTESKLQTYINLWFHLDYGDWSFGVVVTDRYGSSRRDLPLADFWYAALPLPPDPLTGPPDPFVQRCIDAAEATRAAQAEPTP